MISDAETPGQLRQDIARAKSRLRAAARPAPPPENTGAPPLSGLAARALSHPVQALAVALAISAAIGPFRLVRWAFLVARLAAIAGAGLELARTHRAGNPPHP